MFSSLPRRCVVLLEDIDSAGLIKRQEEGEKSAIPADDAAARIGAEISKALKDASENNGKGKKNKGISLSGLLNAIDGVASHEGRVLVMTTNCPEKLDEALIRPGRIDIKVEFTMATRSQISELFTRMYSPDDSPSRLIATFSKETPTQQQQHVDDLLAQERASDLVTVTPSNSPSPSAAVTPASMELKDMAEEFAIRLPENVLTPAEIQGYLLTRKKDPRRALEEVDEWMDRLIDAKKSERA